MQYKFKLLASGLFLLILSTNTYSQNRNFDSNKRFTNWLVHDPVSFIRGFGDEELTALAATGVNLSIVHAADQRSSRVFQKHFGNSALLDMTNLAGEKAFIIPVSAAMFGGSLITDNYKFQDAAFTSLQALLYTSISVNTVKFIASRARPHEKQGVRDFDLLQGNHTSFPSGHTASAFAYLTPWVVYYPGPITYSLYAIPVGTALARIARGKHWLTDVGAGALIGSYWGYYLARKHITDTRYKNLEFTPAVNFNSVMVNVSFRF